MLTILDNPLVQRDITVLRDKSTPPSRFRDAMQRVAIALALESARFVYTRTLRVETPLEETEGHEIAHDIVLLPVLRAGMSLVQAFSLLMPEARIGYIGLQRDEETLATQEYYCSIPPLHPDSLVFLLDPMLATGGSVRFALQRLEQRGAHRIVVISVIAAPEGIQHIEQFYPHIHIVVSALDRCLNEHGFIMPGLGDAGDRYHGTL
ncbi:MAG: uracil phosphoribosyltransferase [Bacteroidota bacterium]|nr:uracil phosphoribosyltransferase [Candidatus Kapabacteria bacterium]MDW8219587.1 uracil phosphoribosyltransferase [Bacteroidota bacterium]